MSLSFHSRTGTFITLSNNNRTAQRDHPAQEFNNGIVLSSEPLRDNQLFEVRIDKKVNSWSGSVEIGVTASDPNNLQFPTSATGFRENTWVMSGSSILKDGHTIIEEYGQDLDQICEGDTVGVKRLPGGVLHIFINGVDHGPAVANLPSKLYAVVDLYGKCAMVTVVDNDSNRESMSNDVANTAIAEGPSSYIYSNERLLFHERCGTLGKLSNNRRTAERRRPLDEFNNGVVMTNRPLKDDELFEIRIDRLVDKWSGSIEVGITTHNPSLLDFPATMTNMRSGTIMMSGCGILTNGKGTRREYGEYNLDDLAEGDRIGLIKKSNGCLHYYINGIDQGVAATKTAQVVWGVVDLYGMAVKVTIVDGSETNRYQAVRQAQPNSLFRRFREMHTEDEEDESQEVEKLLFHSNCGYCAEIINGNRTAHRPNAMDDFNHGVCITNRVLRTNEIFEVRIDKMVDKWAGSIEIGVTTHSPQTLDYPSTMTNIRSGTWMMTGHGVMHNGTTVIDEYGQNLDRLKVGDRLGVIRKEDGTLHFFVNSVDQGPAASNVPSNVYGVLDLYGQAAQATIIDQSDPTGLPELVVSEATPTSDDICFHHLHGQNASVINNGKTAVRTSALEDFNDAIVIGNRPLRDNEIFEVVIEKMVDRWSGSIEAGVTLMRPETIEFPNTMTDMDHDTWMLSGSGIMQDGSTIRSGYGIDLDTIDVNSRIGMMRTSEGDLHYFVNGQDQGVACSGIPPNVYPVVDIYGQCAQVSITNGTRTHAMENQYVQVVDPTLTSPTSTEITHRFSQCCGKNVNIRGSGSTACRVRNFNNGLVFSCDPLKSDELFEVKVDQIARQWSGSMHIGLTTMAISDNTPVSILPATATELNSKSKISWVVCGSEVKKNGVVVKENYATALERLEVGSRVGVRRSSDGTMHIHINGEDMGTAATGIPKNIFAVIDLYGMMEGVTVISSKVPELMNASLPVSIRSDSSDSLEKETDQDTAESISLNFHSNHGKNILLSNKNTTACRTASYNQGIVISSKPLPRNHIFQVKIERLNQRWTSSLLIGVIGFNPEKQAFPHCAIAIKKPSWVVQGDCVFQNGAKVKDHYGPNIDSLHAGHVVGVMVDDANCLHLYVNGIDQGIAARDIPVGCHAIVDLYGQCEQVTTVTESDIVQDTFGADREKADIEEGKKEKICKTPPPEINKIKSCEYMHMCSRFKSVLGLPDGYFEPKHNMCYCELCHKVRGDEGYYKRGEPPKEYALPFGWCRFALKVHQRAQVLNVFEKWHIAYHGTKVQCIRKVLDCGDLLIPGDIAMGGSQLMPQPGHFTENKKPENFDVKQIFLSPTIRYSGNDVYAPKYEFKDPKTKKIFHARVAMQVYVKPGSYKIGPQTIGANEQIDPKFQNNELEWSTKERGSIILYGLLIKIEQ